MENSTNLTIGTQSNVFNIIGSTIWWISVFLNISAIVIVHLSRTKLIQTEFLILIILNTISTIQKILMSINFTIVTYISSIFSDCEQLLLIAVIGIFDGGYSVILLYYSIFQVTTTSRAKLFLQTFNVIHNWKTYLIYVSLWFAIATLATIVVASLLYVEDKACGYIWQRTFTLELFISIIPRFLPAIVYLLGTVFLCYSWSKNRMSKYFNDRNQIKRFRRNLKLMFKFLAFALVLLVSNSTQMGFYIIAINCPEFDCQRIYQAYSFINFIGYGVSFMQPIIIIYIHNILKETFFNFIKNIF